MCVSYVYLYVYRVPVRSPYSGRAGAGTLGGNTDVRARAQDWYQRAQGKERKANILFQQWSDQTSNRPLPHPFIKYIPVLVYDDDVGMLSATRKGFRAARPWVGVDQPHPHRHQEVGGSLVVQVANIELLAQLLTLHPLCHTGVRKSGPCPGLLLPAFPCRRLESSEVLDSGWDIDVQLSGAHINFVPGSQIYTGRRPRSRAKPSETRRWQFDLVALNPPKKDQYPQEYTLK